MNTATDPNYYPLLGTSSTSLVGRELNVYFQNGSWLDPLRKFLPSDKILPASVRACDLPSEALTVKAYSRFTIGGKRRGWYQENANLPECDPRLMKCPRYLSLHFKGEEGPQSGFGWRHSAPKLLVYLCLMTKFDRHQHRSDSENLSTFSKFIRDEKIEVNFGDTTDPYAVCPVMNVSPAGPSISNSDLDCLRLGLEYLYRLFKVGYGLTYDEYTEKSLRSIL